MARNSDDRSLFLRTLAEYPYIYYAAKKAGISPATIHRWMNSNPDFKKEVQKTKREGLMNQNEKVEMVLVNSALKGSMTAVKFYLTHNSKKYRPTRPAFPPPAISAEEREMYRVVYAWAVQNKPMPIETRERIMRAFKKHGYFDGTGGLTEVFKQKFGFFLEGEGGSEKEKTSDFNGM